MQPRRRQKATRIVVAAFAPSPANPGYIFVIASVAASSAEIQLFCQSLAKFSKRCQHGPNGIRSFAQDDVHSSHRNPPPAVRHI